MKSWQILFRIAWGCLAAAVVFIFVGGIFSDGIADIVYTWVIFLFLAWPVLLVVSLVERIKDPDAAAVVAAKKRKRVETRAARAKAAEERREARKPVVEAQREEKSKRKAEKMRLREEKRQYRIDDRTPIEAILIATEDVTKTSTSAGKAFGRAIIGDLLFGAAGAFVGAATTSSKTRVIGHVATFFVTYKTGRQGTETVRIGSERFNELAALLQK